MSVLAFDIKEVFDRDTDARLIKKLWEQGIFLTMIRWVAAFLINCIATLRLDGEIKDQKSVQIRMPQKSPVAPILFMLFTAP